ncbi:MAG TPA: hypothetical protein V6D12_01825 [Candidatus Obscuribacterales bacterium]
MPRQNEGVIAYISPDLKRELESWADEEERSVSWLVGKLIEEAVKTRKAQTERKQSNKSNDS